MHERNWNALLVVIISAILWGAYGVQFFEHEQPCVLCLLQRLGMISVAFGALLNLKFGIQRSHYGISLVAAIFGGFVALRQIALHVCPGFSIFGKPVLGLSLYTWSFIIFASSIGYISLLMIFCNDKKETKMEKKWLGYFAFCSLFLVTAANIFTTLWQCGLGDCE